MPEIAKDKGSLRPFRLGIKETWNYEYPIAHQTNYFKTNGLVIANFSGSQVAISNCLIPNVPVANFSMSQHLELFEKNNPINFYVRSL